MDRKRTGFPLTKKCQKHITKVLLNPKRKRRSWKFGEFYVGGICESKLEPWGKSYLKDIGMSTQGGRDPSAKSGRYQFSWREDEETSGAVERVE